MCEKKIYTNLKITDTNVQRTCWKRKNRSKKKEKEEEKSAIYSDDDAIMSPFFFLTYYFSSCLYRTFCNSYRFHRLFLVLFRSVCFVAHTRVQRAAFTFFFFFSPPSPLPLPLTTLSLSLSHHPIVSFIYLRIQYILFYHPQAESDGKKNKSLQMNSVWRSSPLQFSLSWNSGLTWTGPLLTS